MPLVIRATTTTNSLGQKQRLVLPKTKKSNELDADYLHALQLIDQSRHQKDLTSANTKLTSRKLEAMKHKTSKPFFNLSSSLTNIGQEAMLKSYEDTLFSHISNVYSSKRISNALPRLHTAAFRKRTSFTKEDSQSHITNIYRAQSLLDSIANSKFQKDDMLCSYVQWQQQWTKSFV